LNNFFYKEEQISLSFEDIGGLEDVKQKIQESVIIQIKYPELFERSSLLSSPKGILLYGPPGTGKTMIAKAIAKTTESVFINVNLATIFQKWLGESEKVVTAIFSLAEKMEPSIIFCDEVDSWLGTRSDRDNEVTARVKALFMSLWDGISTNPKSKVTIVAATNRPGSLDQAILRRLPLAFLIGLPDTQQRKQILSIILKDESISEDVSIEQLAQCTEGYSGSDLRALCQTAARAPIKEYLKNKPNDLNSPKLRSLLKQDFMEAMDLVQPTGQSAINYQQHQNSNSNRPVTINVNFMPIIPNNNGN
jgi:SpoVK/Ycf46/Vps4 family AAA+-type ATPase